MLFTCTICAEIIDQTNEIRSTTCGHIFHFDCLKKWLERSKTCPQCRHKCSVSNIHRIYFNIQNIDANEVNLASLQHKLDEVNLKNNEYENQKKRNQKKIQDLETLSVKSAKTILKLEKELSKYKLIFKSQNMCIDSLKKETLLIDNYKKTIHELKNKIESMSAIKEIMESTNTDVDNLIKNENNLKTLGVCVIALKRELKQNENKKTELKKSLLEVQRDLRKNNEKINTLQEKITDLESENYILSEQLKKRENHKTHIINNPIVTEDLTKSLFNLSSTTFEDFAANSNSPYFNIKSSGVLNGLDFNKNLEKELPKKQSNEHLSQKYGIFKRRRVGNTNFVYNKSHVLPAFNKENILRKNLKKKF